MAEFVELRLEEMIPELEQMQRVQLFTEQEIKAIVKKRRDLEYKLQKRTKQKEDYLKYIQYEINLLTLIRLRREKIQYQFKKPEIDHAVANRINKLFFYVEARFPSDLNLWLSHIEFCKRMRWASSISRIFVRLLAVKSNEPSLWIMAAKWEFEENNSVSNARSLLLRALRFHKESIQIYSEAFRLELLEADRLRKRRQVLGLSCEADLPESEEEKSNILDGQLAVLYYNDAKKIEKSAADLLPFLAVAKDFDFTQDLQNTILKDMQEEYSNDEVTWDTIARSLLEKSPTNSSRLKDRVEMCCAAYEDAISRLDTPKMWQMYVETLLVLLENDVIRPRIRLRLYNTCQKALTGQKLLSNHVLDWIELLEKDSHSGFSSKTILEEAVVQFPKHASLWSKLVETLLEGEEEDALFHIDTGVGDEEDNSAPPKQGATEVPDAFWKALAALGPTTVTFPLWEMTLDHFKENIDQAEELFRRALAIEPPVSSYLKPHYLSWIASHKSPTEARKFYDSHSTVPPLVLEFHYRMVDIELQQNPQSNVDHARKVFEKAVSQFGQQDADVWLRFIKFELDHGEASRVGNLHYRAKLTLDPVPVERFLTQYTLHQLQV